MVANTNETIGDVFMPTHWAVMMGFTTTVATGYAISRLNSQVTLCAILMLRLLVIYYAVVLGYDAVMLSYGAKIIDRRKFGEEALEEQKFMNSCKPSELNIGQFTSLNRSTLVIVIHTSLNNLATLLVI